MATRLHIAPITDFPSRSAGAAIEAGAQSSRHDLKEVVLAGHSLGGLTIPGVAAKIPARIKRVVWVTAMVALDGQPIVDPAMSPLPAAAETLPEGSIPIEMMGKEFLDGSPTTWRSQ
jgi:alpha-beta hydrolase superfamily lysophospholipase